MTAREGVKDNGCITNTVMQVTTSPNRISLAVNKGNYTHGMIERTGVFNVSVLAESATFVYGRPRVKMAGFVLVISVGDVLQYCL